MLYTSIGIGIGYLLRELDMGAFLGIVLTLEKMLLRAQVNRNRCYKYDQLCQCEGKDHKYLTASNVSGQDGCGKYEHKQTGTNDTSKLQISLT